jgi:DNA polymerase V
MSAVLAPLCVLDPPVPLGQFTLRAKLLPGSVDAGFPSPADDHAGKRIDILEHLVKHPQATYQVRVRGESMRDEGIFDGDVLLVDRGITARHGHIVVAVVDNEFTCKKLYLRAGRMKLKAGNPTFPDIVPKDGQTVDIWGVVIASLKLFAT